MYSFPIVSQWLIIHPQKFSVAIGHYQAIDPSWASEKAQDNAWSMCFTSRSNDATETRPKNGGFHGCGYPTMDGLKGKFLLKWTIWGYPNSRKPPNSS